MLTFTILCKLDKRRAKFEFNDKDEALEFILEKPSKEKGTFTFIKGEVLLYGKVIETTSDEREFVDSLRLRGMLV